jgi:hypothetical protein
MVDSTTIIILFVVSAIAIVGVILGGLGISKSGTPGPRGPPGPPGPPNGPTGPSGTSTSSESTINSFNTQQIESLKKLASFINVNPTTNTLDISGNINFPNPRTVITLPNWLLRQEADERLVLRGRQNVSDVYSGFRYATSFNKNVDL